MEVVRIAEGLWQWSCPHPARVAGADWGPVVWSTYVETADAVVVIDPLVPDEPSEEARFWRAFDGDVARLGRPVRVLLTCGWHARSAEAFATRHGARVLTPDPGCCDVTASPVADGQEPATDVMVVDLGAPAPNREVAYRLTAHDAIVLGDIVTTAGGHARLAPAASHDETPETIAWHRDRASATVRELLDPTPLRVLTGHGPWMTGERVREALHTATAG